MISVSGLGHRLLSVGFLLLCLRSLPISAQGLGEGDKTPYLSVPALTEVPPCVDGAYGYGIGYNVVKCSDISTIAPCLCNPDFSPTVAAVMSSKASQTCSQSGQGPVATSLFAQFCSVNGYGGGFAGDSAGGGAGGGGGGGGGAVTTTAASGGSPATAGQGAGGTHPTSTHNAGIPGAEPNLGLGAGLGGLALVVLEAIAAI